MTTDEESCPHCGAIDGVQPQPAPPTVQAWTCTACGLDWAITVANPALAVISRLLPTPQLRTGAFLNLLCEEVHQRSGKRPTMTDVVSFPLDQVAEFDTTVTVWSCLICARKRAATGPQATRDALAHLGTDHGGIPGRSPLPPPEFGTTCRSAQSDESPMDS